MAEFPEAAASATVRFAKKDFEVLFTIRAFETDGTAGLELFKRLDTLIEHVYSHGCNPIFGRGNGAGKPEAAPASEDQGETKVCELHNATMKRREKSGEVWYSHKLADDSYCNGQPKS